MQSFTLRQRAALVLLTGAGIFGATDALAYQARLCTSLGAIDLDIDEQRAPLEAARFARLIEADFYVGTIFHRAVDGSLVQGGTFTADFERRSVPPALLGDSGPGANGIGFNALSNRRGTIGASRASDPQAGTAGFFFNLADNAHLDARPGQQGYRVFGRVTAGLELLDALAAMPTRRAGELDAVPAQLVAIDSISIIDSSPFAGVMIAPDPTAVRNQIATARVRNDPAGVLAAIDRLREACLTVEPELVIFEAEAALRLERTDRARYGLEQYLATANARDPNFARARNLYQSIPQANAGRDVEQLTSQCRRPLTPSIPDSRFARRDVMQALEPAVRRFRDLGEIYLTCLANVIDREDLSQAEREAVTRRHNELVVEITAVQLRFNRIVRELGLAPSQPAPG